MDAWMHHGSTRGCIGIGAWTDACIGIGVRIDAWMDVLMGVWVDV